MGETIPIVDVIDNNPVNIVNVILLYIFILSSILTEKFILLVI